MTNDSTLSIAGQDIFDVYHKLTKTEIMIYVALRELGDVTQSEIARYLGVTARKVRQAVSKLREEKVVKTLKNGKRNEYFFAPIEERKQEQTEEQKPEILPINNNDKISTDKKELSPDVFNNLQTLCIKNLPQTKTSFSRKVTKKRTPHEWLLLHDPEGAIAGRVSAWAEFKANGGLIDVNPVLLWLNILQGIEPPTPNAELSEMQSQPEPDNHLTEPLQDADIADTLATDATPDDGITEDAPNQTDAIILSSLIAEMPHRKNLLQGAKIAICGDSLTLTTNKANRNPAVVNELIKKLNVITENVYDIGVM